MKETNRIYPRITIFLVIRIIISVIFAFFLPLLLYYSKSPWLSYSYTAQNALFEYFGFATSLVIIINLVFDIIHNPINLFVNQKWLSAGIVIVLFAYLLFVSEYSRVEWDYLAYENAARNLISGSSPYQTYPFYIYPPLLVQTLEFVFKGIRWIVVNIFMTHLKIDEIFFLTFYFYQCLQYLLIIISFILCYLFGRKIGLEEEVSALLCVSIFLINTPLLRNMRLGQINLQLLIPILILLLWSDTKPILSGATIAYGALLKIYTAIFVLPWLISKKWKPILSALLIGVLIVLVQTNFFRDFSLYKQFLLYVQNIEQGTALRNNSLSSLSINFSKLINTIVPVDINLVSTILLLAFTSLSMIWIGYRFYTRQNSGLNKENLFIANAIDTIGLMYLISPSVWDHHFVMAIPLAIYATKTRPDKLIGIVGFGILLLFFIPTYDVFFLSYNRLLGLILLLFAISPAKVKVINTSDSENYGINYITLNKE